MKIAISGAHRTGKTTLVAELARSLPGHETIDEPYALLEEDGHVFADPPSLEDFELQLERSIALVSESGGDLLFDRCPADLLAYLLCHDEADAFDRHRWLPRARSAMRELDLVVFVPVELPDRVPLAASEAGTLRERVDEELRSMLLDDPWDLGVTAIEVMGSSAERARQVLALGDLRGARR